MNCKRPLQYDSSNEKRESLKTGPHLLVRLFLSLWGARNMKFEFILTLWSVKQLTIYLCTLSFALIRRPTIGPMWRPFVNSSSNNNNYNSLQGSHYAKCCNAMTLIAFQIEVNEILGNVWTKLVNFAISSKRSTIKWRKMTQAPCTHITIEST